MIAMMRPSITVIVTSRTDGSGAPAAARENRPALRGAAAGAARDAMTVAPAFSRVEGTYY
jgi:hypothetical protein